MEPVVLSREAIEGTDEMIDYLESIHDIREIEALFAADQIAADAPQGDVTTLK